MLQPVGCILLLTTAILAAHEGENVARNKPYTYTPAATYPYTRDDGDATQLTDGVYTAGHFWTRKSTVGWMHAPYVTIDVDLGTLQPVGGLTFSTAAGVAGVEWPWGILILASEDGTTYRYAGDLITRHQQESALLPLYGTLAAIRLQTTKLQTRARFVRLVILPKGSFVFCDELTVLRGPDALLTREPTDRVVSPTPAKLVIQLQSELCLKRRLESDRRGVMAALQPLGSAGNPLLQQLQEALIHDEDPPEARLPYKRHHARLFRIQAQAWAQQGVPTYAVWRANPWDPLSLHTVPQVPTRAGTVAVHAMIGETRSAAINVLNASPTAIRVPIWFEGLPESPRPSYITVDGPLWTYTSSGQSLAAALEELPSDPTRWYLQVESGMPGQIWFSIRTHTLPPGAHEGRCVVQLPSRTVKVPFTIQVYDIHYPAQQDLLVSGWEYSDSPGKIYGLTPENKTAVVQHIQARGVNVPWATSATLLGGVAWRPDGTCQLDTARWDTWRALWPAAPQYRVFLNVGSALHGHQHGTPEFDADVATWINAWADHWASQGVRPEQVALLLIDEIGATSAKLPQMVHWSSALKAAQPGLVIWNDPYLPDVANVPSELIAASDVICVNRVTWHAATDQWRQWWRDLGKPLEFYSPSRVNKTVHECDPYSYYRLQAWDCWALNAGGSSFWAFADNGGGSPWRPCDSSTTNYAPMFLDATTVTPAKHMEAMYEGVEDYQTFVLLARAIADARARGVSASPLQAAHQLLQQGVADVVAAANCRVLSWQTARDRELADMTRVKILQQIAQIHAFPSPLPTRSEP